MVQLPADQERHFVSYVLAFFAASDGIVLENLAVRFMQGEDISLLLSISFARCQYFFYIGLRLFETSRTVLISQKFLNLQG